MRIAVCSDEPYAFHNEVVAKLEKEGHEVVCFGSFKSGDEESWPLVARAAAEAIACGDCEEGVFFCWTGTGVSMAANKVPGIRAALCCDPETARGARVWNHANVLVLSNRLMTPARAIEILQEWLDSPRRDPLGDVGVQELTAIDMRYRRMQ